MLAQIHDRELTTEGTIKSLLNISHNEINELHVSILYMRRLQRNTQKKSEQYQLGSQIKKCEENIKEAQRYIEFLSSLRDKAKKSAKTLAELVVPEEKKE